MTAPTSPGVVPADVRELVERLRAKDAAWQEQADGWEATAVAMGQPIDDETRAILRRTDYGDAADMLERLANRPSLTEDEREQVRREALAFYRDNWLTLSDTGEPYEPNDALWKDKGDIARRALADRSEPRQEKEGSDA